MIWTIGFAPHDVYTTPLPMPFKVLAHVADLTRTINRKRSS